MCVWAGERRKCVCKVQSLHSSELAAVQASKVEYESLVRQLSCERRAAVKVRLSNCA